MASKTTFAQVQVYGVKDTDSVLTADFIKSVCNAVISRSQVDGKFKLEQLILETASGFETDSLKTVKWHRRFGNQCICPATKNYEAMNFLRLVVQSNFRAFANIIGPRNRLPLDFELKDSQDSLNIYDYVNQLRKNIESEHDDKRFEFQQDEKWRNLMFFYFLFSEYYLKQY